MQTMGKEKIDVQYFHRDSTSKAKALEMLKQAKERDAARELVAVRVDERTIKLMPPQKAEKFIEKLKKLENEKQGI